MVQVDPAFEAWKSQNGIIDPTADDDGDGQSNYSEYAAGTNPHDSKSAFQILKTTRSSDGFGLRWASVGGKRYRIQYCDNLTAGFVDFVRDAKTETDSAAPGQSSQQSFTDTSAPTNEMRYYRIMIVP
jgi:hypothetical protein